MAKKKEAEPKKSGMMGTIVVVLVLTLVAVGAGWGVGAYALKPAAMGDHAEAPAAAAPEAHGKGGGGHEPAHGEETHASAGTAASGKAYELEPITANISAPDDVWVRLELAVLFAGDPDEGIAEKIHQDILAFIQTIKLYQVEGASGIRHFRRDINDLARIRGGDRVKGVLIRALLFE